MTPNDDQSTAELLALLCDEAISPEQMQRLDRLICTDAAVRRLYMEYLDLHARLSYQFHQPAEAVGPLPCGQSGLPAEHCGSALPGQPFAVGDRASWRTDSPADVPFLPIIVQNSPGLPTAVSSFLSPFGSLAISYLLAAVIVGIGLLIGWACQVSTSQQVTRYDPRPAAASLFPKSEMAFVGRVTGMIECRWADQSETAEYAYVSLGRKYSLLSGLMEITYDRGAKVILQGPCIYVVESETGGYLSQGKVTALVTKKAEDGRRKAEKNDDLRMMNDELSAKNQDSKSTHYSSFITHHSFLSPLPSPLFSIRTPTALVTDFGTEFGVEVNKDGATASHVFRGKVVLTVLDGDEKQNRKIALAANESARIEREPGSKALAAHPQKADAAGFVRSAQFAAQVKEIGELPLRPFRAWQAASEGLRKREDLLAYYDFQRDPDHPRDESGYELLRNRASTGRKFDGRVRGAIRMGMTQGRFPGKDALRFIYPSDGVRINIPGEFSRLTLAASVSLERNANSFSGIFMSDKWERADYFHWQFTAGGSILFGAYNAVGQYPLEAPEAADFAGWHVWCLAYDGPDGRLTAYVDGRRLKEWTVAKGLSLKIGEATIGNWDPRDYDVPRPLSGRMDEFAIFAGTLRDADIKQIFLSLQK
jgi:hypothetical protein